MGKKNNYIELNGKRYDALTGELLSGTHPGATKPHGKKAVDGVVHTQKPIHHTVPAPKKAPQKALAHQHPSAPVAAHPAKRTMDVIAPRGPHHVKAHQPEHTQTLMRHAVKKPADLLKRHAKAQIRTDILAKAPKTPVLPKFSFHNVDPERLVRAKRIAKSRLIRRFAPMQDMGYIPSTTPSPASATLAATPISSTMPPVSTVAVSHAGNRSMDIFQKALTHATSHEQPAVHTKRRAAKAAKRAHASRKSRIGRRVLNTGATILAVLLVAGFIGYQNKANITMHVASAKAGFHANLPSYKPAGFAVGKFQYSTGVVAINYHSNSDNRSFNVTQKASNWDSETLLDNFVAVNNEQYQVLESGGRTIYIYGNNNASWVDNGIWYQVKDNGSLSTNQVLNLAGSM